MTTKIIYDQFKTYLTGLAATNAICDQLGTTFSATTNLFVFSEYMKNATCLTIIPYAAGPPSAEGDRQEGGVQLRLKTRSLNTGYRTQQALINDLHENTDVCASTNGKVFAVQSVPIQLEYEEGEEFNVIVSNYIVKYIKLT